MRMNQHRQSAWTMGSNAKRDDIKLKTHTPLSCINLSELTHPGHLLSNAGPGEPVPIDAVVCLLDRQKIRARIGAEEEMGENLA